MIKKLFIALCSLLTVCGICVAKSKSGKQIIKNISIEQAYSMIEKNEDNPDFIIVDVRTPEEFSTGHIEGALLVDYNDNFESAIETLDQSKTYLIYCRSGNRSGKALNIMQKAGFLEVYNMKGGITAWKNADYYVTEQEAE